MKVVILAVCCLAGLLAQAAPDRKLSVDVQIKEIDEWMMMRQLPVPFPNEMVPTVPEQHDALLDLGRFGRNCVVVIPDEVPDTIDGRAFRKCVDDAYKKIRSSKIIRQSDIVEFKHFFLNVSK